MIQLEKLEDTTGTISHIPFQATSISVRCDVCVYVCMCVCVYVCARACVCVCDLI